MLLAVRCIHTDFSVESDSMQDQPGAGRNDVHYHNVLNQLVFLTAVLGAVMSTLLSISYDVPASRR